MEIVLLFIFALVVSLSVQYASPRFYATTWGAKLQANMTAKVLSTALLFFVAIYAAAILMAAVGKEPSLPKA